MLYLDKPGQRLNSTWNLPLHITLQYSSRRSMELMLISIWACNLTVNTIEIVKLRAYVRTSPPVDPSILDTWTKTKTKQRKNKPNQTKPNQTYYFVPYYTILNPSRITAWSSYINPTYYLQSLDLLVSFPWLLVLGFGPSVPQYTLHRRATTSHLNISIFLWRSKARLYYTILD